MSLRGGTAERHGEASWSMPAAAAAAGASAPANSGSCCIRCTCNQMHLAAQLEPLATPLAPAPRPSPHHAKSTAAFSMCTRLCRMACREARLPPLPRLGAYFTGTSFTCMCKRGGEGAGVTLGAQAVSGCSAGCAAALGYPGVHGCHPPTQPTQHTHSISISAQAQQSKPLSFPERAGQAAGVDARQAAAARCAPPATAPLSGRCVPPLGEDQLCAGPLGRR